MRFRCEERLISTLALGEAGDAVVTTGDMEGVVGGVGRVSRVVGGGGKIGRIGERGAAVLKAAKG